MTGVNKGCGMCYSVSANHVVVAVGSSLAEWSFTLCLMPHNHKIKCVEWY